MSIGKYPEAFSNNEKVVNSILFDKISSERIRSFTRLKEEANKLQKIFNEEAKSEIDILFEEWEDIKNKFQFQYNTSKTKASSNQNHLDEIQRIENKLSDLSTEMAKHTILLNEIGAPELEFNKLQNERFEIYSYKLGLLAEQSHILKTLSNNVIKAEYKKSFDEQL